MPKDDFEYISKIGKGSFSIVEKVKRINDGKYYAMKKVLALSRYSSPRFLRKKKNTPSMKYACLLPLSTLTSLPTMRHFSIPTYYA